MHIAKDYPKALSYMIAVGGNDNLMCYKEATILFVDKYKALLNSIETMEEQSQKEKEQCKKKSLKQMQSKTQSKSKKRGRPKKLN